MDDVKVSVVISLSGHVPDALPSVSRTLTSLSDQDYPLETVEVLVCQHGLEPSEKRALQERFPHVQITDGPEDGYYRLKNLGIEHARGEIVAIADADCVYSRRWLAELVATIEAGADIAVGFSRLEGDSLPHRICGFYDQHQMLLRTSARLRRFNSNNVAFRAALVKECMYDPRFDRSGGCVQLAERLLRRGARMEFSPSQTNRHAFYGYSRHTWKQAICSGYDFFHTRAVDPEMPLARLTRLPLLGPPLISAIFVLADLYNVAQNRRILGIRWFEAPAFLVFSLLMRPIEMVGMYWARLQPTGAAHFVARNFA